MNKRFLLLGGGIAAILFVAAGWYFISPLFINRTVDEQFPFEIPNEAELEELSSEDLEELAVEVQSTAAEMPDKEMEDPMPEESEPLLLVQGEFQDADSFHQGSGRAALLQLADGTRFLRLEDFSVTNGPDLHVYLATGSAPTGRSDLGDFVDLGEFRKSELRNWQ